MENIDELTLQGLEGSDLSTTYLTFKIDGQHYGIGIGYVIEILQLQPTIDMPNMPDYSKGVINLRGQIVPIIDVSKRFGKPEKEYTERACIIIVNVGEVQAGLTVDAVEEVMTIESKQTSVPPAFAVGKSSNYVIRIATLEKYMALLLNVSLLVEM